MTFVPPCCPPLPFPAVLFLLLELLLEAVDLADLDDPLLLELDVAAGAAGRDHIGRAWRRVRPVLSDRQG